MEYSICHGGIEMEKHISKLLPNNETLNGHGGFGTETEPLNQKCVDLVNKLFVFFYATCRGFEKQFQDPDKLKIEKTQWFRAFTDINLTDENKVDRGVKKCRLESPINVPTIGQFVKWCTPTPADLGLLTKEQAYNRHSEFIRNGHLDDLSEKQNLILKHVIQESGQFFLKTNPMNKTEPVFFRNYEIAVRDFIDGKLKAIPKALEDRVAETQELKKQEVIKKNFDHLVGYEQNMQEIRKILGMKSHGHVDD